MMIWRRMIGLSVILVVFGMTMPGFAQPGDPELRQDIEALKEGQQEILKQLDSLQRLLEARRPGRRPEPEVKDVVFNLRDNPSKGVQTAKLTLVEFTDYQ